VHAASVNNLERSGRGRILTASRTFTSTRSQRLTSLAGASLPMRWPAVLSVDKPFAVMQAGVNIAHNFIDCDAPDWSCRLFTLQERLIRP
jgi:hypothetical protein